MNGMTVSHNAQPQAFVSEVKMISYQWVWATHRRCETVWVSVDKRVAGDQRPGVLSCLPVLVMWEKCYSSSHKGRGPSEMFFEICLFFQLYLICSSRVCRYRSSEMGCSSVLRGNSLKDWAGSWPLSLGIGRVEGSSIGGPTQIQTGLWDGVCVCLQQS